MRIGLVTTTIHPPEALYLLRKYGPDVDIYVAVEQDVSDAILEVCRTVGAVVVFGENFKCSDVIGWKKIQRRNVALLVALERGADVIVSWDTDNLPLTRNYFVDFEYVLSRAFSGLQVSGIGGWFDVGRLLDPPAPQRGIPPSVKGSYRVTHAVDARVGVCQGLALGDPDISALYRMACYPFAERGNALLDAGVAFKPEHQSWTVWNTQNTAFLRELAPAMFCAPSTKRYDDIYASLVTQRVMRERGYVAHYGKPYAFQERNPHDLQADLRDEIDGMQNICALADHLDAIALPEGESVIEHVRIIYESFRALPWYPSVAIDAALAFCDDCEEVL